MADQWTHDRPSRAPARNTVGSKNTRRRTEQQPRLELPVPTPRARPEETEAQPATEAPRGVAEIDFYV